MLAACCCYALKLRRDMLPAPLRRYATPLRLLLLICHATPCRHAAATFSPAVILPHLRCFAYTRAGFVFGKKRDIVGQFSAAMLMLLPLVAGRLAIAYSLSLATADISIISPPADMQRQALSCHAAILPLPHAAACCRLLLLSARADATRHIEH